MRRSLRLELKGAVRPEGNDSAFLLDPHSRGVPGRRQMRRYSLREPVDLVIVGCGGPAYPRGYARLGAGQREHWEAPPEFNRDPVRDVPERGLE